MHFPDYSRIGMADGPAAGGPGGGGGGQNQVPYPGMGGSGMSTPPPMPANEGGGLAHPGNAGGWRENPYTGQGEIYDPGTGTWVPEDTAGVDNPYNTSGNYGGGGSSGGYSGWEPTTRQWEWQNPPGTPDWRRRFQLPMRNY